ncbi:MAG: hypothetical protein NUV97_03785 [archaeon]|nr:hypothetical protein [archaeon]MCR4323861.1 hypothetical protein [Nanoarchaeota archaeon]
MVSTDDILKKYGAKIDGQMKGYNKTPAVKGEFSQSYETFRSEMMPEFTKYEKWCKSLGNVFKMNVGEKDKKKIERNIYISHLNITASEVVVFATMLLLLTLFGGVLFFVGIWLLTGAFSIMFLFLVFILSVFLFFYSVSTPDRLAMKWRLKASSQMVPAILYIVIYMKHTSNFEKAVAFAAEHLEPPLSLDFRKIFWDVEVGRFSTIKASIDYYLEDWKDYSTEFIESFHLIESSLYEPEEARRVGVLEKSLQVILDGVYDKMLKYTHEVKSPLTNVYMLGIVLPTLALAILPLASTMLGGAIKWYHVLMIFNVIIPFMVIYLTQNVMMQRPGGYGESSLLEKNPLYGKYLSKKPYWKALVFTIPLFLVGLIPFFWRYTHLPLTLGFARDYSWIELGLPFLGRSGAFGIIEQGGNLFGPFGALSLILSLFIPLSIALFFVIAYKGKTEEILTAREKSKSLEKEFTSSLFQLGNRIGDGIPAEIAFAKIADSTKGTATEGFFRLVNGNIQQLGMSLERSLFDPKRGAVIFYPSQLVATSMRILVESVKKGLKVAARSLMSISDYVKNIKKINERLNDLLADIISDMKSNMTFLAPLLSGIIVGLSGMITTILGSLSAMFASGAAGDSAAISDAGGVQGILSIFDITQMIPTYWLQIVVGIYLVQIVFILTSTLVTIKSGRDLLQSTAETGRNLKRTIVLYTIIAFVSVVLLTLIASVALSGLT